MGNLSHRLLFKEELSDFLSHHVGNLAIFRPELHFSIKNETFLV
ncbi:hypothetical protein SP28804_A0019, partial [Streptococcus pneumoniae CDC0288-04]